MEVIEWCLVAALLLQALVSPAFGQQGAGKTEPIVISAIENEQTHELAKEVVREAYERIGLSVVFDDLPARRALIWANSGKTDGDLARIDGTEKKFPGLIKIPTPVTAFKGVVFTRKIKQHISSWEDLKGLSIGVITGIRYSEIGTKDLNPVFATDMPHLFKLLAKDRIDVAIAVGDAGRIEIHRNFKEDKIHIIGRPVFEAPLFHFVNEKNKDLAPRLGAVLREMMENGEIQSIHEKALQKAMAQ
jgi:ABC-type amino acid transport substrate-binding protein